MGVLAPSSRGVTKVHEDSGGCTVPSSRGGNLQIQKTLMDERLRCHVVYLKSLMGSKSPWCMVSQPSNFVASSPVFGAGAGTGRFFLKLLSVIRLVKPRLLCHARSSLWASQMVSS